jgi:hypothetical protein
LARPLRFFSDQYGHAAELASERPGNLYRIGTGEDCCIEGGPQHHWGMFSYAFYQQIEKNTPEFGGDWGQTRNSPETPSFC